MEMTTLRTTLRGKRASLQSIPQPRSKWQPSLKDTSKKLSRSQRAPNNCSSKKLEVSRTGKETRTRLRNFSRIACASKTNLGTSLRLFSMKSRAALSSLKAVSYVEGMGHTPDSAFSISTSITRRYDVADAIVLVDNAAQPMQGASCAVLRSLVASGHENKLVIAFTHFDDVKGDNLPTVKARKAHVH